MCSPSSAGFAASIITVGFALGLSIIEARLFALTPMSPAAPSRLHSSVFQILTEHLAVCEIMCERRHELCHRSRHRVFETEALQRLARRAQANRCCS